MQDFAPVFVRVARRYRGCGRGAFRYVKGKLRYDPVHRDVLALAEEEHLGNVLDLGSGRGQLGIALLETGLASSVVGIDRRIRHLAQARRAACGLAYYALAQDLTLPLAVSHATTVLLIDLLYQLADDAQYAVLLAACGAAQDRIIIRTLDPDRGARSRLTMGVEHLVRRVSPHSGALVNPWSLPRILAVLTEGGFAASIKPCWGGTPFANVLIIARRAG